MSRALLLLPVLALGCVNERERPIRLQSFQVSLQASAGSEEAPLPFVIRESREFVIDIQAMDSQPAPLADFSGPVTVSVVPGQVVGVVPSQPVLVGGRTQGVRVSVRGSFGPTHVWVEDASGVNPFALGASPTIWFENPRVRDIQQPLTARDSSPMTGSNVTIDRGNNIVVHVSNNGFYVVDRDQPPCDGAPCWNTVFAFNFNRPEGLRRGEKLLRFSGTVGEFLGFTELNFPLWDVDHRCPTAVDPGQICDEGEFCVSGACLGQQCGDRVCAEGSVCQNSSCVPNPNIPDPVLNPPVLVSSQMERHEGGLVQFTDVLTTQQFKACDDPSVAPGANNNGVCEFCRTCNSNRDLNGVCPDGGRCCPIPQVCNVGLGECTSRCNASRATDGSCPDGAQCCTPGNVCDEGLGMCDGCTIAEKAEAACDDECALRGPASPGGICTNLCDYREFGQYRVGLTTGGQWNGASFLLVTSDTVPFFRADAPENRGKLLPRVTGVLRNIFAPGPLWIVEPRDECDIDGIVHVRTDCDTVK